MKKLRFFLTVFLITILSVHFIHANPVMVKDIYSGSTGSGITKIVVKGNNIYFPANDGTHGDELWKSDGTTAGTSLVKDINSRGSFLDYLYNCNDVLYLSGGDAIWKSDGTANGTIKVKGISNKKAQFEYSGGITYFIYSWIDSKKGIGSEVWKTNGTSSGTVRVKDINPNGNDRASLGINVNGTFCFLASDGTSGWEQWKSDGSSSGTLRIKDIYEGSSDSWTYPPENNDSLGNYYTTRHKRIVEGSNLYFVASDGTNGSELWKSDGTASGTTRLTDVNTNGDSYVHFLCYMDDYIYFVANDGTSGFELYRYNLTSGNTNMVKDIFSGEGGSYPRWLVNLNGTLFFFANDGTNGWELWKSNGTESGTVIVTNINPKNDNADSYLPGDLSDGFTQPVVIDDKIYFAANDGDNGTELWVSDGTADGTEMLSDINSGSASSIPVSGDKNIMIEMNGKLYFLANDGTHGEELWVYDPLMPKRGADDAILVKSKSYSLNIYPNPADDMITIEGYFGSKTDVNIRLINLFGIEILNLNKSGMNNIYENMNTSNLTPGMYMLEVRFGCEAIQKKIIKK